VSTAADPHFDSLQYIASSGAWDASGSRFAMAALSKGNPVLVILDTSGREPRVEVAPMHGVGGGIEPRHARAVFFRTRFSSATSPATIRLVASSM